MKKTSSLILVLVAALFAVAAPILMATYFVNREAVRTETDRALGYARDVIHRSDATADQIHAGINQLVAAKGSEPCSPANVALMRWIDVSSSYIQSIGWVVGNRLVCSSLAAQEEGIDLGPVDVVQPTGAKLRMNVELPFAKGTRFLVVERDGYAAIIHKNLPIDTTIGGEDVSLASVSQVNGAVLTVRGAFKPEWATRLAGKSETTFIDGDYVVAAVASQRYKINAIAALPTTALAGRISELATFVIPIGVIAGGALALLVIYLARMQTALPAMIKAGLKRNEFFVLYEPVVDLKSGEWVGAEALMRWQRGRDEVIRPDLFIPVGRNPDLFAGSRGGWSNSCRATRQGYSNGTGISIWRSTSLPPTWRPTRPSRFSTAWSRRRAPGRATLSWRRRSGASRIRSRRRAPCGRCAAGG